MGTPLMVPPSERSESLKAFLADKAQTIATIQAQKPGLIPETASPLLYLVFPWIAPPDSDAQKALFADRQKTFEDAGFNGAKTAEVLSQILQEDRHLRECCVNSFNAARCFDLFYLISATWAIRLAPQQFSSTVHFQQFESTIYNHGRLKNFALCHLFNFQAEEPINGFGDLKVEQVHAPTISKILGETSPLSFLHPRGTGDFFIVIEKEGACDDFIKWLLDEKNKADLFLHVLQYFKDGIVHIDYAVPYFSPEWVNQVRKWGVFFVGNPRRTPFLDGALGEAAGLCGFCRTENTTGTTASTKPRRPRSGIRELRSVAARRETATSSAGTHGGRVVYTELAASGGECCGRLRD